MIGIRRECAHPLAHLKPIHPGQHDIEQHQVRSVAFNRFEGLDTITYGKHLVVHGLQVMCHDFEQLHIIIDHQDGGLLRGHTLPSFQIEVARGPPLGNWTWNVLPAPSVLSTRIIPPCSSMMRLQMARPTPRPFTSRESRVSTR